MKQLLVLLSALVLISCNKFKVEGSSKGVKDGTKVYLVISDSTGTPKPQDTVVVKNNKFEFEGKAEFPDYAFISFDGIQNGSLPFILENGTINLTFDGKETSKSTIAGTDNNDLLQGYNTANLDIQKKYLKIMEANKDFMPAQPPTADEQVKINKIEAEFGLLTTEMDKRSKAFIKKNEGSFISLLLVQSLFFNDKMDAKEVKTIYDNLSSDLKKTKNAISIKKTLDTKLPKEKKVSEKKK